MLLKINYLWYWHDLCYTEAVTIHLGKSHEQINYRRGTCHRIAFCFGSASEHLVLWNLDAMEQCRLHHWNWYHISELQPDQLGRGGR